MLILAPPILTQFLSAIPFWKAGGLASMRMSKISDQIMDPWEIIIWKSAIKGAITIYFALQSKKFFHRNLWYLGEFLDLKFFFNLDLPSLLQHAIFWIKHFREKYQKVDREKRKFPFEALTEIEESRPPLDLKNNGVLPSDIFLWNA